MAILYPWQTGYEDQFPGAERLTVIQRIYLYDRAALRANVAHKRTITSLVARGYLDERGNPTMKTMDMIMPPIDHPAARATLQAIIDRGPQDVHREKWPHWKLVGAAQKNGEVRVKLEPVGGMGSMYIRLTLSWPDATRGRPADGEPGQPVSQEPAQATIESAAPVGTHPAREAEEGVPGRTPRDDFQWAGGDCADPEHAHGEEGRSEV